VQAPGRELLSPEQIAARVDELATEIARVYGDGPLVLLAVLKGAAHFASDLMRRLDLDVRLEFIRAKSYEGTDSSGTVRFNVVPEISLEGRDVLVVEDILDTGRTCAAILRKLEAQRPKSLAICTLLDKPSRRIESVEADYVGFTIEDHFVVGYGLDHDEQYRQLPGVYVLE
jgi:hypoxanthine phosphoribosyltransferase